MVDADREHAPDVTTREEFHDQLRGLVRAAASNDVEVRGGWTVRRRDDAEEGWDIDIVLFSRRR